PDGQRLYFISNRTGFFNVWGVGFDPSSGQPSGEPFRVTNFESPAQMILPDVAVMEMALAADRIVLPIMEVSGGIWILESGGPKYWRERGAFSKSRTRKGKAFSIFNINFNI